GRRRPPPGWFMAGSELAGSQPSDYDGGTDATVAHSGSRSGFLQARPDARGFGTAMQAFKAERFRGTRPRQSAFVRAADVDDWSGFWMREDGPDGETMSFDNMGSRPITGTTEWRQYRIVLDVPETADLIALGVLLQGLGRVWIDDVEVE